MSEKPWTGNERRAYCELCKEGTDKGIKSACKKASIAIKLTGGLVVICFILSGIAWSAKSNVANQKEKVDKIHDRQEGMAEDLSAIAEFVNLLKNGNVNLPYRHDHAPKETNN